MLSKLATLVGHAAGGEAVHAGPEEEFRGGVERETRHEVLEGVVVVSVRTGQA